MEKDALCSPCVEQMAFIEQVALGAEEIVSTPEKTVTPEQSTQFAPQPRGWEGLPREQRETAKQFFGQYGLKSDTVTKHLSSEGFSDFTCGDRARLTRDVQSGAFCLNAGEIVTFREFDPNPNICWVTGNQLIGIMADVPIDALEKFTRLNKR